MYIEEIIFQETMPVRHAVLWPNLPITFCSLPNDELAWHYGIREEGQIICVASLFVNESSARLRKFATLQEYQGQGYGTAMLEYLTEECQSRGIEKLWFDARESALDFYKNFGFEVEGERFFKKDVAYFRMSKSI